MRASLFDFCQENARSELLREWDAEKNGPSTPQTVTYGSRKSVWWKCENGHQWQAAVYARTEGSGCPYCTGRKAYSGENDLATQRPDLISQWHPKKNGALTPDQVTVGSHKTVWRVCEKGHEWRSMVKTRVKGCGCPVCANRILMPGENDLASTRPELARQWHPTKNGSLTPDAVGEGTKRKVWWICEKGHEWQAAIVSRSQGTGCPVCAGKIVVSGENDLATAFPTIAAEWNPSKNGSLNPTKVSPYSNKKVWWRCPLGHEYPAMINHRTTHGSGCPYCTGRKVLPGFNDLAALEPKIAEQWHPTLNGTLTPEMVTVSSHKKVWWECAYGHVWQAVIYSRTGPRKSGCPVCAGTVKRNRRGLQPDKPVQTAVKAAFENI